MRLFKRLLLSVAIALMGVLVGCEKEGATGPQGPIGLQGQTGARGQTGAQGQTGPGAKSYYLSGTFGPTKAATRFTGLTSYQYGDFIVVYLKDVGQWIQMPFVVEGVSVTFHFNPNNGDVTVEGYFTNGSAGSPFLSNITLDFMLVHIKSAAKTANPNVNFQNYQEVADVFNL